MLIIWIKIISLVLAVDVRIFFHFVDKFKMSCLLKVNKVRSIWTSFLTKQWRQLLLTQSLLSLFWHCLYNWRQNQNSRDKMRGGGCKTTLCRRMQTFIAIDTIDSRNYIHCMWFGECIDVGSKYSLYKILV